MFPHLVPEAAIASRSRIRLAFIAVCDELDIELFSCSTILFS